MRSLKKSFGTWPKTLGFSLAETWFPVRCQNLPLSITHKGLHFVLSGLEMDERHFLCVALSRNTHICVTCSLSAWAWGSVEGFKTLSSSDFFWSPSFLQKPLLGKALASHLCSPWLMSAFVSVVVTDREARPYSWKLKLGQGSSLHCLMSLPPAHVLPGVSEIRSPKEIFCLWY